MTSFSFFALAAMMAVAAKAWRHLWCAVVLMLIFYVLLEIGTSLLVLNYAELSVK